jgi:hypothetical protein
MAASTFGYEITILWTYTRTINNPAWVLVAIYRDLHKNVRWDGGNLFLFGRLPPSCRGTSDNLADMMSPHPLALPPAKLEVAPLKPKVCAMINGVFTSISD